MGNTKLKICAVTTTRADYGIMRPLLIKLNKQDWVDLRIAVTGTHLLKKYGNTAEEISQDGLVIDKKISILRNHNNNVQDTARIMAKALLSFTDYFLQLKPDLVILLGDRFETFQIATAAAINRIPIVHIAGGETTQGAQDEFYRHSISKMSYLHFAETDEYRKRIIQLGEDPKRVFNTGSLSAENVTKIKYLSRKELSKRINFELARPYCLVTFHPVTMEGEEPVKQLDELLKVVKDNEKYDFIITKSNMDLGGEAINKRLEEFAKENDNCVVVASLGTQGYFSAIKYCTCVIGNSSSGLIEVPLFGKPTINIGDRQKGRVQGNSVINCEPVKRQIEMALDEAESFHEEVINPYKKKGTSDLMLKLIKKFFYNKQVDLKKAFYDLEV